MYEDEHLTFKIQNYARVASASPQPHLRKKFPKLEGKEEEFKMFSPVGDNPALFINWREELLFTQKLDKCINLGINFYNQNANYNKSIRHVLYLDDCLLLAISSITKTVRCLCLRLFSVPTTWPPKYGGHSKNLKSFFMEERSPAALLWKWEFPRFDV